MKFYRACLTITLLCVGVYLVIQFVSPSDSDSSDSGTSIDPISPINPTKTLNPPPIIESKDKIIEKEMITRTQPPLKCDSFVAKETTTLQKCIKACNNVPPNMGMHNRAIVRLTATNPPFFLRFYPFEKQDELRWPIYADNGLYYENVLTDWIMLLKETDASKKLFLDLGANIGWASLLALSIGARVISVEASPATYCLLESSICLNGYQDRTILHNFAIADVHDTNTSLPFFIHPNPGASRICYDPKDRSCLDKAFNVPARNINQILESSGVGPDEELYMVKMDVERIEHLVLPTLVPLFRDHRINMFYFEFCNSVDFPILAEIISHGYDFYVIKEGHQPSINIDKMFNSGNYGPYNSKTFTRAFFNTIHSRINNAIFKRHDQ